ncbi:MAG: ubiquinol-cytochrome C chaperone family protein [Xanthobacteraceae bacterium]
MLLSLRRRSERRETIERLYGAIVAQARLPVFYTPLGVPDTIESRFDLIVLHVYLLFRRLAPDGAGARAIGQGVFDTFVADMDGSLREMGTGDLAVPRRMRAMGEAFYGRAEAYDAALAADNDDVLAAALSRNVYGDAANAEAARKLARYVRGAARALASQDSAAITRGEIHLPMPEE